MKKVILFDFHNTLATCDGWLELEIETLPSLVLAKLQQDGRLGRRMPNLAAGQAEATALFKQVRQGARESGREVSALQGTQLALEQMGIRLADAEVEPLVIELENACLPKVEMVEGTDRALGKLRDAGYRLGVVSSAGYPPFVEMALEKLGLRPYFSEIVTSAGEGIYKSDPAIFRLAVAKLGAAPQEAVHVGDHALYDVKTAKEAGLSAVWFVAQARRTAHLHSMPWEEQAKEGAGADAVVNSMDDLPEAIEALG